MTSLSEFDLIERYFAPLAVTKHEHIHIGTGDDCGVIATPPGTSLCFSIDTMVEGVHFPKEAPPFKLGYRALAAALSDLAACGAKPYFFTLALTLPEANSAWLEAFSSGLKYLSDKYNCPLLGGDTTRGPLTISIQVHGLLSKPALQRKGAKPGDILAVSGTLGDAGAALEFLSPEKDENNFDSDQHFLLARYYTPEPRIELGQLLLDYASACIDISDGLLAEAKHISKASQVRIEIDQDLLPISDALMQLKGFSVANNLALNAGDDYELLFTIPQDKWQDFMSRISEEKITRIGQVESGFGVEVKGRAGEKMSLGFQHFE